MEKIQPYKRCMHVCMHICTYAVGKALTTARFCANLHRARVGRLLLGAQILHTILAQEFVLRFGVLSFCFSLILVSALLVSAVSLCVCSVANVFLLSVVETLTRHTVR